MSWEKVTFRVYRRTRTSSRRLWLHKRPVGSDGSSVRVGQHVGVVHVVAGIVKGIVIVLYKHIVS